MTTTRYGFGLGACNLPLAKRLGDNAAIVPVAHEAEERLRRVVDAVARGESV